MAKVFGREYTRDELLRRIGDISQVGGVNSVILDDGSARGVRAAEFKTGSGLNFTVLLDRGLDIAEAIRSGSKKADVMVKAYNLCDGKTGVTEVARRVSISKGSMSAAVARWEEKGILYRDVGQDDSGLPCRLFKIRENLK